MSESLVIMSTRAVPPNSRPFGPNAGRVRTAPSRIAGSELFMSLTISSTVLPPTFSGHLTLSFFSPGLPEPPDPGNPGLEGPPGEFGCIGLGFFPPDGGGVVGGGVLGRPPPGNEPPGLMVGGSFTCADLDVSGTHRAAIRAAIRNRPTRRGADMG